MNCTSRSALVGHNNNNFKGSFSKMFTPAQRTKQQTFTYLKPLIGIPNNTDKGAQYQINKQRDKDIQIQLAEYPNRDVL